MERSAALAVVLGAVAGAALRWWLTDLAGATEGFDWMLLTVNVVGSGLLGVIVTVPWRNPVWAYLLGPGFCGSFTTFSAFAVDAAGFLRDQRFALAVGYVAATVAAGVAAAALGQRVWSGAR